MNDEGRGKAIRRVNPSGLPQAEQLVFNNIDLLTEILGRLPLKSIDRFKSVSKHWLSLLTSISGYGGDGLHKKLWMVCAGPLMDVPRVGERVFYFPQGHLEQVMLVEASTNVELNDITPLFNLPAKILCVVRDIKLRAETDTEEVYARITLVPEQDQNEPTRPDRHLPEPLTPKLEFFCNVLRASDVSRHGGLSLHRRHVERCLPPLDMNQPSPLQELIAKDLHGREWRFKHIFRGEPKRHLLTTGWDKFVTSKRLVAGDSVVFLMGENGELRVGVRNGEQRVGVRRSVHQQVSMSSSAVSSRRRMHVGVLAATVCHAMANPRSPFVVVHKPTKSQFIVGLNTYLEAVNNPFAVGMRFKMRFEDMRSSSTRYTGTIVGVEDHSSQGWRSLMVQWDEAAVIARPNRVSPWEIEPFVPNE